MKKGVEATLLGREMGLFPEQLLYTVGPVGEGVALDKTKVENAASRRHR